MVSKIRMDRRKRQEKHIPSPKVWNVKELKWEDNPELKPEKEK